MKSEHRHELKTNELAEWLANFPEWLKENIKSIIALIAIIVAVLGFYGWRRYDRNVVQVRQSDEFTSLLNSASSEKMQVAARQSQGIDSSHYLIPLAANLKSFAENTNKENMAALALIKEAETLRAELHYRLAEVDKEDFAEQIERIKASYNEAASKASSNPLLMAAAKFGLGLCAEELGDYNKASQIYQEIVSNASFEGTVYVVQAQQRIKYMSDYRNEVVFKPGPKKEPAVATRPTIQIEPFDANMPADTNIPVDVNFIMQMSDVDSQVPDINLSSILPDDLSKDSDVNVPVE